MSLSYGLGEFSNSSSLSPNDSVFASDFLALTASTKQGKLHLDLLRSLD